MNAVALPARFLEEMKAHARESYPDECCGFLIGRSSESETGKPRSILALERARNEFEGERRRRFLIRPEELREVERRVELAGQAVVGFYHSHPDHPARPSQFDQDHGWPWYAYVIVGVTASDVAAVGAFELDPDSAAFREVRLDIVEATAPIRPMTQG